ncbi:MAG TPA: plasmid replication protein, CyRepA1 family [Burkholderiales bacterium]|nr:plasmid replication protein, CyRepA1 family [Burkholderiales bacterium]
MQIAISTAVIDKANANEFAELNRSFRNVDISVAELANHVAQGHPFCAQHANGWRNTANFLSAGFLAVDIDHGLRLNDCLNDPFVKSNVAFIYTTANHTEQFNRFRIVCELERPITGAAEMKAAQTGLIARFGGDASCKDACHLFYGSHKGKFHRFYRTLSAATLTDLIAAGKERRTSARGSRAGGGASPVRSRRLIPITTVLQTSDGLSHPLDQAPSGLAVHCPVHSDQRASAVVVKSRSGTPGVWCSACNLTYFAVEAPPTYPFDYGLRCYLTASAEQWELYGDDQDNVDYYEMWGGSVIPLAASFLTQRHFCQSPVVEGLLGDRPYLQWEQVDGEWRPTATLTAVRSPKGSGKTELLAAYVKFLKKNRQSVLLIGHRQSLISATAERLGLTCYFDYVRDGAPARHDPQRALEDEVLRFSAPADAHAASCESLRGGCDETPSARIVYREPSSRFAICVDSLSKRLDPKHHRYDVVIVDESEQVFAHLLADTLKGRRRETLVYLRHYLRSAKGVCFLDADLSRVTLDVAAALMGSPSSELVINQESRVGRVMDIYRSKNHLIRVLEEAIGAGRRCYVAANSKRLCRSLCAALSKRFRHSRRIVEIDSENSQNPAVQDFIRDIRSQILNVDCLIASPSLGTGIDISFPDGACRIDHVFGFFEGCINTHFDIDQQLSRVRNPGSVAVWVSPTEYRFETEPAAIQRELSHTEGDHRQLIGINDKGEREYAKDEIERVYEMIYSEITAMERGSKNRLRTNFVELRKHNGWDIRFIDANDVSAKRGGEVVREGKAVMVEEFAQAVLAAAVLERDSYEALKVKATTPTPADSASMRRYELESFYKTTVTRDLIIRDDDGTYRRSIRAFEMLLADDAALAKHDKAQEGSLPGDRDYFQLKASVLQCALRTTGLFSDRQFDVDAVVTMDSLRPFAQYCLKHKAQIARLFNVTIRNDEALEHKPTQVLGKLLAYVGLRFAKPRIRKLNGRKIYEYRLDAEALERANQIRVRRASAPPDATAADDFLVALQAVRARAAAAKA